MAAIHRLTQKDINNAQRGIERDSRLSDGGGLSLHLRQRGAMYWSVQVTIKAPVGQGKRIEVGLGRYPDVTLKRARELASEARGLAREGIDVREERKRRIRDNQRKGRTFKELCEEAFKAQKAKLKGGGKNGRWMSPLEIHAIPKIGDTPIEELDQRDLANLLKPIWHSKAPTAAKCIDRIGIVFKHAAAADLDVSLETVPKARVLLGAQDHVVKNIEAMAWQDVPDFYTSLVDDNTVQLALMLLILTGARSYAIRFAHASQFQDGIWTIPAANMKGQKGKAKDFSIPISKEAQRVVMLARDRSKCGYLFPSPRKGVISDMAMSKFMKEQKLACRPHGFRSTLRDWMTEETDAPFDTRERVLAHKIGDRTTQAYDRSDDLKRRAVYMERWSGYVSGDDGVVFKLLKAS
ncbi:integrase [Labrenzia sp. EL_126]|nr:integrase [Labrenzia sp. EL_126]